MSRASPVSRWSRRRISAAARQTHWNPTVVAEAGAWPGRARGQAHPVSVRDRQADDRCTLFLHGTRLVYLPMTRQTHRDDGDGGALPPRVAGWSRLGARARTIIHLPCRTKNTPSVGRHCSTVARQPRRMPAAEYKSYSSPPSRIADFFMPAFRRFSLAVFIRQNTLAN